MTKVKWRYIAPVRQNSANNPRDALFSPPVLRSTHCFFPEISRSQSQNSHPKLQPPYPTLPAASPRLLHLQAGVCSKLTLPPTNPSKEASYPAIYSANLFFCYAISYLRPSLDPIESSSRSRLLESSIEGRGAQRTVLSTSGAECLFPYKSWTTLSGPSMRAREIWYVARIWALMSFTACPRNRDVN